MFLFSGILLNFYKFIINVCMYVKLKNISHQLLIEWC